MDPGAPTTLEIITAIGSIVTPILIVLASGILWVFQRRIESAQAKEAAARQRAQKLEEEIRDERVDVYNNILAPFIAIFSEGLGDSGEPNRRKGRKAKSGAEVMQSIEYRQAAFKLSLFASDEVIRAFNNLMQFAYAMENATSSAIDSSQPTLENGMEFVTTFSEFLLTIRRSVGNETTTLRNLEMLEWMISDLRTMVEQPAQANGSAA